MGSAGFDNLYRPRVAVVAPTPAQKVLRALEAAFWWSITVVVLVVLDDVTFGPVFWTLAVTVGPVVSFLAAMSVYVPVQVWLVHRATEPEPGRAAAWMLRRLYLNRRVRRVARNEQRIHGRVVGALSAVALSPVVGGVLPPLVLNSSGYDRVFVRRVSWVTATAYALTFAVIHGIIPAFVSEGNP